MVWLMPLRACVPTLINSLDRQEKGEREKHKKEGKRKIKKKKRENKEKETKLGKTKVGENQVVGRKKIMPWGREKGKGREGKRRFSWCSDRWSSII